MGSNTVSNADFSESTPSPGAGPGVSTPSADLAALQDQAVQLIRQGRAEDAEVIYRQLIASGTTNYVDYVNLAAICGMQGRFEEVISLLRKALQLNPLSPEAHGNLGIALKEQGQLEAAVKAYSTALQLNDDYPEAHYNLGIALKELGDVNGAIASYNKALALQPDYIEAHFNLGQALLLGGDYKTGWLEYEWRTKRHKQRCRLHAQPACQPWSGDRALAGSQLLLISEFGLGDTLQFMRYVPVLRQLGVDVSLCAQPKLHGLIKASGIHPSPQTPEQANATTQGHWLPLLSVPRLLEVSPTQPIISEPYIRAPDELISKWQAILAGETRPIIGICWQGNPEHETGNFRGRSLLLETFASLAQATKTSLLSLQKGFGSEQLATCSFQERFVRCQQEVDEAWDFLETAAIIANCDLVVSTDTATAHLAGAMGIPTWLLLKKVPEWRWGLEGETSFWYPSMRIFRQHERGNWDEVLERVTQALQDTALSAGSSPTTQQIHAPISLGELIDKITILEIKTQHLQGIALNNVQTELAALQHTLASLELDVDATLIQSLKQVNSTLWQIEDDIRAKEHRQDFGEGFIQLARSVYQQNDRRAAIKKAINITYRSALVEEKSYEEYSASPGGLLA